MAVVYADRAEISINGKTLVDVQSANLKQNQNAKAVPTMTPDKFNRGFVQGNRDIDIALTIAVEKFVPRPKLENIDYETNSVQLTFIVGESILAICTGLFNKDAEDSASGVGEEVKTSFNFGAIKVTDAIGNGVLFDIAL